MFSKALATLTGVFLILYMISETSATPASAGKAQNTTQALAPRALDRDAPPVSTFHGYCVSPFTYVRQECLGGRGKHTDARGWEDICGKSGTSEYNSKQSTCDPGNYCLDTYLYSTDSRAVYCVPLQKSRGKQLISEQYGFSDPKTSPGGGRASGESNTDFFCLMSPYCYLRLKLSRIK